MNSWYYTLGRLSPPVYIYIQRYDDSWKYLIFLLLYNCSAKLTQSMQHSHYYEVPPKYKRYAILANCSQIYNMCFFPCSILLYETMHHRCISNDCITAQFEQQKPINITTKSIRNLEQYNYGRDSTQSTRVFSARSYSKNVHPWKFAAIVMV